MAESTSEEQTPTAAAAAASSPIATTPGKKGSVADRVAWLQNAFNKDNNSNTPSKRDIGLESSTSVSDRKRWMEEEAFRKHLEEKGMDTAGTSHASVVAERKRWLDEQAERNRLENEKNQVNKQGIAGSPRGAARSSSATQLTTEAEAEAEAKAENETTNTGDAAAANQGVAEDVVEEAAGSDTKDDEEATDATDGEAKVETEDKNDIKEDTANEKEETTNEDDKPEEEKDGAEPPLVEEDADEEVAPADNDTDKEEAAEVSAAPIAASKPTRPSSQDPPIKTTASTMMRATETAGTGGSAMPCLFSSPVFAQQRDQMEFFLPAACSCPKCRAELAEAAAAAEENGGGGDGDTAVERADPTSLKTILRPWQVEFLMSQGITTAHALVNVEKDAESRQKLCKQMKRWRKERDLPAKTISCLMACRIWAKTSEEALKNAK